MSEPIIYDASRSYCNFFDYPKAFTDAYVAWLGDHGIDKNVTYRTEHRLIDAPLVRVFQYERDEQGRPHFDETTREMAVREPFDVLIKTPAPSPEDYA